MNGRCTCPAVVRRLGLASAVCLIPGFAWAYRPFVSTDADVTGPNETEIELGYFGWERAEDDNAFITPQLVINYGVTETLEVVGEFEVEHPPNGQSELVDPGLFLKALVRQGVLQDKPGPSIAVEAGLLLPSTIDGEDRVGFEAIGIVSGTVSRLTWHLNLGGGVNRVDHDTVALWGLITEFPATPTLTLVSEVNGEHSETTDTSALVGAIWEPASRPDLALDIGIRRGISRAAPDWGATLGLTFSF